MQTTVRQAMCVRDEGRPLGAGMRRQATNHLERLGARAPVGSVKEKARRDCVRCGSERRTRVNHRRSVESVWTTSKPGFGHCSGISAGGDPLTASVASGIKVARARSWLEQGTWEPVASMLREEPKWKTHEGQSTDAGHRGEWARINPAKKLVREYEDLVVSGGVSIVMGRGAILYSVWSGTVGSQGSSDGHRVTRWTFRVQ